ncbi:MAG: sugar phosphate isomerase/epimerase family protein [Phycisphaeraceae bacterium]
MPQVHTRTGSFPIGFRVGGSPWQKDAASLTRFAREHGFAHLDTSALPVEELQGLRDAGLGSVDLPQPWTGLASADPAKRSDTAKQCADYIAEVVPLGVTNFFVVVFPENREGNRAENLKLAVDSYGQLCQQLDDAKVDKAHLVIEGYPGGPPHHHALACTPADCRLLFDRVGSDRLGVNYDPSHLVRMGIDPLRFAREFADRIHHVHAKDTDLLGEGRYQHGNLQPASEAKPHGFGGHHWRYTIPGHGVIPWTRLFQQLADAGYEGKVSIELEDENFNGSEEGEQRGLLASRDFLVHA